MNRNLVGKFSKRTFLLIFASLLFFFVLNDIKVVNAAVWTTLPAKKVNDVAVNSRGEIYITKTDGTINYSVNGTFYILIPNPPNEYPINRYEPITTFEAKRIAIAPNDVPWAIFLKTVKTTDQMTRAVEIVKTHHLYYRPVLEWIECPGAQNPEDVTVSTDDKVFVTSATAPYNIFSSLTVTGTFSFTKVADSDEFSRISAGNDKILWAVKRDGTLWKFANKKWTQISSVGINDVGASHFGKIVGLTEKKESILGQITYAGAIWYSSDFGVNFTKDSNTKNFQNIAVSSNNVLYAADLKGVLWKYQ